MTANFNYSIDFKSHPEHLTDLFHFVNSHQTLMESATLTYEQEPQSEDPALRIPKQALQPIQKTPEEYLQKFLPPIETITTQMIGSTCTICLEPYLPKEQYRRLLCGHHYHRSCLDTWMSNNLDDLSCPLCRKSLYSKH